MARSNCCSAYRTAASCAARPASSLCTVACCLAGSIWSNAWPAFTAAPDLTKICVMMPSTCGRTSVERRDFNTATNSELMVTGFGASTSTPTGNAGACCGPVGWPLEHPTARTAAAPASSDRDAKHDPERRNERGIDSRMNGRTTGPSTWAARWTNEAARRAGDAGGNPRGPIIAECDAACQAAGPRLVPRRLSLSRPFGGSKMASPCRLAGRP